MKVLVTGAAGLYGVHLVDALVQRPDIDVVYGVDNFSRNFFDLDPFIQSPGHAAKFKLIRGWFQDMSVEMVQRLDLDVVVHLAASVSIPESMESPEEYFLNNEYATFRFVHTLAKLKKRPALIYASSPEVYGNPKYTPMDIDHPLYPRSVYAVTKLASEKHCRAIYEWYNYPVVIIRNFNTFGENQNIWGYTAVVPMFIMRALRNEPIEIHGDGSQTRDFMYVKNAVAAYVAAISRAHELSGSIFNIGSGQQLSILDLAKTVIRLTGSQSRIVNCPSRLADIFALHADITETQSVLGWAPTYTFEQGLDRTISWYRRFVDAD